MDHLRPDRTLSQNINEFYFRNASIDQEFRDVYTGLFQSADRYIDIVSSLGRRFRISAGLSTTAFRTLDGEMGIGFCF